MTAVEAAPGTDTAVTVARVTKRFGGVPAVDDFSLDVPEGSLLVLLGPSGCGKTTVMRSIVGLEAPDTGAISVGGRTLFDAASGIDVPAHKRNVGMVFQSYAIWPHLTVYDNVAFPLRVRRVRRREMRTRVTEVLELLGLEQVADRGASRLSGGQMQRVALARSLVMAPAVLLLDEPLSNLDAKLRDRLRVELRRTQRALGTTMIYVTHDQSEALALADRIAVMRAGRLVQIDDPVTLYNRPRSRFVANFIGDTNLYDATVLSRGPGLVRVRLDGTAIELDVEGEAPASPSVALSLRPEHVRLDADVAEANTVTARVLDAMFLGTHVSYELAVGDELRIRALSSQVTERLAPGAVVTAAIPRNCITIIDEPDAADSSD